MLHLVPRRTSQVRYFIDDPARELEGVREGPAGRFLRGSGDPSREMDVSSVLRGTSRSDVVGYDLIISASRPLSALLAVGANEIQQRLVALHHEAVHHVVTYIEERALTVRFTERGEFHQEPASLSRAVAFTHGVNRAGDPHLHDHVLFGSASREFGRALHRPSLKAHLEAADALYHAHLREGLTREGVLAWRDFRGRDHVAGVDLGLLAVWPRNSDRHLPKVHWSREEITTRWREQAERRLDVPTPAPPERSLYLSEHTFGASFEGRHSIGRRHIVAAFANAAPYGIRADALSDLVTHFYPDLSHERGVSERHISLGEARQLDRVRVLGPRPTSLDMVEAWSQRSRVRDGRARSR